MTEYSRMAKGNYTVVGGALGVSAPQAKFIFLPFKPDYVELINYTQAATPAAHGIPFAWWDASVPPLLISGVNYDTVVQVNSSGTASNTDMVKVNGGINAFSGGLSFQYGPVYAHNSVASADFAITKAAVAQITTATAHGLSSGDVVIFSNLYQTSTTGMQQIAGIPFVVTVTSSTVFTIPWDSSGSNYTAFNSATSTGNVGSWKQVLYPALYAPAVSFVSAVTLANPCVVSLTMPGNYVVGQEVAFRIPLPWGPFQLNSLPDLIIPGSPIYGYVTAVSASLTTPTITVNIDATAFTAFNANQPFANFRGLTFPQVVPVGDINSGGWPFTASSGLYPSPNFWNGNSNSLSRSINGPAIQGAFCNNTAQGFIVGNAPSRVDTASWVGGSDGDVIEWRAYYHDLSRP
jgi:hypothetical protein